MGIAEILEGCSLEDARSCLYYASRYVKQAEHFESYEKDIFEEEEHNVPSARVRELTLRIIDEIEAREGRPATQFDDETVIRLLDEITSIEASLSPEFSDLELARGKSLAAEMLPPMNTRFDD